MSAILDAAPEAASARSPSARLRTTMAAVRLSFTWLGVRKSLTPAQKALAAESFGAEGDYLSAGKKLLDTKHPAFRSVTAIRGRVQSVSRGMTLPFPEPGVRLLRRDQIEQFDALMTDLRAELANEVANLDAHFAELKATARHRLGSLFNADDYPGSLIGLFGMEWDFPSVEPPSYLQQLSPELYEQEKQRIAARFDEAVTLAEQAFAEELAKLVAHLTERLSGAEDGRPKVFRDSAITNLGEFFERFKTLNIRSNEDLDNLVIQAQRVVRGVVPQTLRDDRTIRERVASQLGAVQTSLSGLMVDRPRRRILRELAGEG